MVIVAIDVGYQGHAANVAAITFETWTAATPTSTHKIQLQTIAAYEPGAFYKRELPCLLAILNHLPMDFDLVVVDGYVWLGDQGKKGLGAYLYEALEGKTPVVGVAKSWFKDNGKQVMELQRGTSNRPLYVSAVGIDLPVATECVKKMYGHYRFPDLLRKVDQLSKEWPESKEESGEI